ncbi:hypothetical protein CNMCM5623_002994 [Aspergillus felis]|uniref:Uncharacterized protein n=1 Tax=Aspergillus felis TaxID=1287682 RepID=A0A8H6UXC1_9EURO|nr:hypothetical protein CNMCM5623_002994 [Aspergillus felis]
MRLTSLFSVFAAVVAVKAATNTTESAAVETIVKALKQGDFVGAAIDLFTLGNCNIADDAVCLGQFATVVVDCGNAAVNQGKNPSDDLNCFKDALAAIGNAGVRFPFDFILMLSRLDVLGIADACLEEGFSIAQALIQ